MKYAIDILRVAQKQLAGIDRSAQPGIVAAIRNLAAESRGQGIYVLSRTGGGRMRHVTIGYILKSLLYFLRCRIYDGRRFLTAENDPEHYKVIADCLRQSVHPNAEHVRKAVLKYLNGEGRIDVLPE